MKNDPDFIDVYEEIDRRQPIDVEHEMKEIGGALNVADATVTKLL